MATTKEERMYDNKLHSACSKYLYHRFIHPGLSQIAKDKLALDIVKKFGVSTVHQEVMQLSPAQQLEIASMYKERMALIQSN